MAKVSIPPIRLPWREKDIKSGNSELLADYLKVLNKTLQKKLEEIGNIININATKLEEIESIVNINATKLEEIENIVTIYKMDKNLVGHWPFDEGAGTTAFDSSGHGNNGTIHGASWVDGISGKALSFDGEDDYVDCGDKESLIVGNKFTEVAWIYPMITDSEYHGFLGYQVPEKSNEYRAPSVWVYSMTKIHAGFGDGTTWNKFVTGDIITENAWNHVVVTFDGTYYKVYINGVEKYSTDAFAGKIPYPTPIRNIGKVDNHFNGIIDEVRIYNRALTAEEIKALYLNHC